MLSLFWIVTLEFWTDIMYLNMFGCENYGYDGNIELCTNSNPTAAGSVTFFVSFVLIDTIIFLNLFIGVIMNVMDEAKAEMALKDKIDSGETKTNVDDLERKLTEMKDLLILYKMQNKN